MLIIGALAIASTSVARADLIIYDMSGSVQSTLRALGTDFVIGCAVLAAGIVAAVIISKKK